MKKKIVSAIFVMTMLVPGFANAESSEADRICGKYANVAETAMKSHQVGRPLSDTLQGTGDNQFLREVILMAYEQPRYSSERYQQQAISKFRDKIHVKCLRHF